MNTSRVVVNVTIGGLLVLLLAAAGGYADGVTLRYKFVPGQEMTYDVWATGVGSVEFSGMPIPDEALAGGLRLQFNANADVALYVKSVDEEGNGTVGYSLGPLQLQMEAMSRSFHVALDLARGTVEVDGETQQIPAQSMAMVAPMFQELEATISPRGKVLAISGLPQLPAQEGIELEMPWATEEGLNELLNAMPPDFPEGPVEVGDSWEVQMPNIMALMMPGEMEDVLPEELPPMVVEYRLKSIGAIDGHAIANIEFHFALELADLEMEVPGPSQQETGPQQITLGLQEIVEGNTYFDLETGQVHSARGNIVMNVTTEFTMPEELAEFMDAAPGASVNVRVHFVVSPG